MTSMSQSILTVCNVSSLRILPDFEADSETRIWFSAKKHKSVADEISAGMSVDVAERKDANQLSDGATNEDANQTIEDDCRTNATRKSQYVSMNNSNFASQTLPKKQKGRKRVIRPKLANDPFEVFSIYFNNSKWPGLSPIWNDDSSWRNYRGPSSDERQRAGEQAEAMGT